MKIFLGENYSCSLNYQHSLIYGSIYKYLVKDVKNADIIIVPSTCCCTEKMIIHTLSYIESLYLQNKDARIIVTGCITRKFKKPQFTKNIDTYFQKRNIKIYSNLETNKLLLDILADEYDYKLDSFGYGNINFEESKAILFISTGCMNNCSFCKSTYQEMPLKSANMKHLINSIDEIDKAKIANITIRGTNISQYGYDLYGKYRLPEIISYINNKPNIKNVNLVGFAFKEDRKSVV